MTLTAAPWRAGFAKIASAWGQEPAQGAFERLWLVFMSARVAIAIVLVVLQIAFQALGKISSYSALALCAVYLVATLGVRLWAHPRPHRSSFDTQWVFTIGVDVMMFSLLDFFQASGVNYTPLFVLPVLLASVLGPILLAFGTAASVTLLLLADAAWISMHGGSEFSGRFLQAGLSGSGFFLVALLANQLVLRLAQEEQLVKKNESAARMQVKVNELVVASLADGVLVIDASGMVRSANPAAQRLLASEDLLLYPPFELSVQLPLQPLHELMQQTFARQCAQEANLSLAHPSLNAKRLHVRSSLTSPQDELDESLCVMFLQDLREMEARLRIQKLAAMGRMSAAVAHEIRNPLAAISQANALLEEELTNAGQRQLTNMIGQNALRLAKIVDEVLDISRAQQQIPAPQTTALVLDEAVSRIASDWAKQNAASNWLNISADSNQTTVPFDDEHLRRLIVNLLDNALRYASGCLNSIEVITYMVAPGQARLAVWSDGQPLEESVQSHLFEPFFSSESRSSGLGLYICRELCERYGALIGYQRMLRDEVEGNEFFVLFRSSSQRLNVEKSFLDSVFA